ncbi:MAG: proton-conducting membrane transporter, partial [Lachnospiraceae bacterium]|nr:proton-conducting membrane transporter [Lachnospiraceae bacterium]
LTAAFAHMLMHSLTKICSFFCCGIVMEQTGKEYIEELSGLGRVMKKTFVCFTISSLSLIGIPLFCGFYSKWRIGLAAIDEGSPFAITGLVAVLFSALLTAIYMLGIVIKAYFPAKAGDNKKDDKDTKQDVIKEHDFKMLVPVICFAAGILILGIFWQPVFEFISF